MVKKPAAPLEAAFRQAIFSPECTIEGVLDEATGRPAQLLQPWKAPRYRPQVGTPGAAAR